MGGAGLSTWFQIQQSWFSVFGVMLDALGFGLITLEWYRGYVEMRARARMEYWEKERAEKQRLKQEHKDMLAMTGIPEVVIIYENEEYLSDAAASAHEAARIQTFERSRALPFLIGAFMCFLGFLLQFLGQWPGGIPWLGIVDRV